MVAGRLGLTHIDTGAVYRALAHKAIREGVDAADGAAVSRMLGETKVLLKVAGGRQELSVDGVRVGGEIRAHEVSAAAADISGHREVRARVVEAARAAAADGGVVMDGRDIGTVVLADAELKVFLTASVGERARRRYAELAEKGGSVTLAGVAADIEDRDRKDATREDSPLRRAEDAVLVDSTAMGPDEVAELIVRLAGEKAGMG